MTYVDEVLADEPLGLWLLDETSGSVATDSSGNANHGTYVGSPALASTTLANLDPSPSFVDDYVALPAIDVGTGPYTIEAVARADVLAGVIISEDYTGGANPIVAAIGLDIDGTNADDTLMATSSTADVGSPPYTWHNIAYGPWVVGDTHHVVLTFDGTASRFYVDGTLAGFLTRSGFPSNDGWRIGGLSAGSGVRWNGSIAGAAIYDVALDAGRVTAHYESLVAAPSANPYRSEALADEPLGLWMLNETIGTIAIDSSGNANHGTYVGKPVLGAATLGNLAPTPAFVDDYVTLPAVDVGTGPYTIEAVARADSVVNQAEIIAGIYSYEFPNILGAVGLNLDGASAPATMKAGSYTGAAGSPGYTWITVSGDPWVAGDIHHVALTYDGTDARFYVDGTLVGTVAHSPFASNRGWRIGGKYNGTGAWNGSIGGVAVYATALDVGRVSAHFDAIYAEPSIQPPLQSGAASVEAIRAGELGVLAIYSGGELVYSAVG